MPFDLLVPPGLAPVGAGATSTFAGQATTGLRDAPGPMRRVTCREDDVVQITWADGLQIVVPGSDLVKGQRDRGVADGPVPLPSRERERGVIVDAIVKLVVGAVAEGSASEMARRIDAHQAKSPGWCHAAKQRGVADPPRDGHVRLLLHGTFSNTASAFANLLGASEWTDLPTPSQEARPSVKPEYKGAFGFDHYTLTQHPLDTARALVKDVRNLTIDIVSHSRGGLVGDVLAAACHPNALGRAKAAAALIRGGSGPLDLLRRDFVELATTCSKQQISVLRHVRVGCPARGTTLASSRLDTWLNVLVNAAGFVSGARGTGVYELLTGFLTAVVKERANPDAIPGLWSMVPTGPFVRWLSSLVAQDRLTVIAGTNRDQSWLLTFAKLLADLFFGSENDLVVDTAAMTGGASRTGVPERVLRCGDGATRGVIHFGYFGHDVVRAWIAQRLTIADDAPEPAAAELRGAPSEARPAPERPLSAVRNRSRTVVVLIPDSLGTGLQDKKGELWPVIAELAEGGLTRLALDEVKPSGVLHTPYGRLVEHLTKLEPGKAMDVVPFAWDWRRSIQAASTSLSETIRSLSNEPEKPIVHLLAHGAGGLVARGLLAWHLGTWKELQDRGGRLVMLGTPNLGTHRARRILLGEDPLIEALARVDLTSLGVKGIAELFRGFPGLLELLPVTPGTSPAFGEEPWPAGSAPSASALEAATAVRRDLAGAGATDAERMRYVAGRAAITPCGDADNDGEHTTSGDGVVLWTHGRLPGVPAYLGRAVHGALADSPHLFAAIADLLTTGETRGLGALTDRPVVGKPQTVASDVRHPDETDLVRIALGGVEESDMWTLEISVHHGELALEPGVVLAGHIAGGRLRGAEPWLDLALNRALLERLKAGRYPQAVGTVAFVPTNHPPDKSKVLPELAIIVGLGSDGSMSRTLVGDAFRNGVVDAARPPADRLVPTGASGVTLAVALPEFGHRGLTLDEAVNGVIEGMLHANRALAADGLGSRRVGHLRIIVSYGDHAADALRIARRWLVSPAIGLQAGEDVSVAAYVQRQSLRIREGTDAFAPQRPIRTNQPVRFRRISARAEKVGARGPEVVSYSVPSDDSSGWLAEQDVTWSTLVEAAAGLIERNEFSRSRLSRIRDHSLPLNIAEHFDTGFDLQISVDSWTAAIPWEAFLSEGVDASAVLSGRISILRQYESNRPRSNRPVVENAAALLVCAPGPADQRLEAVEREIANVQKRLKDRNFSVEVVGDEDAAKVRDRLAGRYEIVHIAGHGIYTPKRPDRTGLLTATKDVIGRRDLRAFLRDPPALVFLNCCHLGRIQARRGRLAGEGALAADLATFLVESGVRAVVAAGWAVRDASAEAFAREFYSNLLGGQSFRNAVAQARLAARQAAPGSPTWAAYQCYGDPDFVLPSAVGKGESVDAELLVLLARTEAVSELEAEDALGQVFQRIQLTPTDEVPKRRLIDAALRFFERLPDDLKSAGARKRIVALLKNHPADSVRKLAVKWDDDDAVPGAQAPPDLLPTESIAVSDEPAPAPRGSVERPGLETIVPRFEDPNDERVRHVEEALNRYLKVRDVKWTLPLSQPSSASASTGSRELE